jgi:hypothetical protein
MQSGKFELFMVAFLAALIVTPLIDYVYDVVAPKLGLPTLATAIK